MLQRTAGDGRKETVDCGDKGDVERCWPRGDDAGVGACGGELWGEAEDGVGGFGLCELTQPVSALEDAGLESYVGAGFGSAGRPQTRFSQRQREFLLKVVRCAKFKRLSDLDSDLKF